MDASMATVVCFSNLDWGWLRYRKQHLMSRLACHTSVAYVNPPRAVKARCPWRWNRWRRVSPTLSIVEPIVLPGVRRSSLAKRVTDACIVATLRSHGCARPSVVWIYSPHALPMVDLLEPRYVVYDMADDYLVPSGATLRDEAEDAELKKLQQLERQVMARADLVLAVSPPLAARAAAVHHNVRLLPNGADIEAARAARPSGAHQAQRRPRIGYVGTLAPRVDLQLFFEIAARRPEWDVVLVGPRSPLVRLPDSPLPPNLVLAGEIPYEQVAGAIASFDVGVLPLLQIPFAYHSSPIQVYDYLAAGLPVVSSPVAALEAVPDLVSIARGPDAFVGAIDRALASRSPAEAEVRRAFASNNSWDVRTAEILHLLDDAGVLARPSRR